MLGSETGSETMASSAATLQRLQQKALHADQLINVLKLQIQTLHQSAVANACRVQQEKLEAENASLRQEVNLLKSRLSEVEIRNGVRQVPLPDLRKVSLEKVQPVAAESAKIACVSPPAAQGKIEDKRKKHGETKNEKVDGKPESNQQKNAVAEKKQAAVEVSPAAPAGAEVVDASRLNMRIGFIVSAKKHPDADSLYVEDVDVGEAKHRTIVSGLVKAIPLEEMQQRYAVFLLNLKPAKMRGVLSEGMIMCASTPEKVEIITPPSGVIPGDRVTVDGYPGTPDDQLNPKKKTWEQIQPDLRINENGFATYKGGLWRVEGKGTFKAPTLINSPIK